MIIKPELKLKFNTSEKIKGVTTLGTCSLDIFTTDTDFDNIEKVLNDRKSEKATSLVIIHKATREDDDRASEFIDKMLDKL